MMELANHYENGKTLLRRANIYRKKIHDEIESKRRKNPIWQMMGHIWEPFKGEI